MYASSAVCNTLLRPPGGAIRNYNTANCRFWDVPDSRAAKELTLDQTLQRAVTRSTGLETCLRVFSENVQLSVLEIQEPQNDAKIWTVDLKKKTVLGRQTSGCVLYLNEVTPQADYLGDLWGRGSSKAKSHHSTGQKASHLWCSGQLLREIRSLRCWKNLLVFISVAPQTVAVYHIQHCAVSVGITLSLFNKKSEIRSQFQASVMQIRWLGEELHEWTPWLPRHIWNIHKKSL